MAAIADQNDRPPHTMRALLLSVLFFSSKSDDTNATIERAENIAEAATLLFGAAVIVGVAAEYIAPALRLVPLWNWPGLAVAIGVAGEIAYGFRGSRLQGVLTARARADLAKAMRLAAIADDHAATAWARTVKVQEELTEATERLAKAEAEAAEAGTRAMAAMHHIALANERAARMEKQAADARERTAELMRLMAPRRLSSEGRQGIIEFAKPLSAEIKLLVQFQGSDAEAFGYAQTIASAFLAAGVTEIEFTSSIPYSGLVWGVHAQSDVFSVETMEELGALIVPPFLATKRDLATQITLGHFRPTLYIFVGPKITRGTFDEPEPEDTDDAVWP